MAAKVIEVVDGDTVKVKTEDREETVRYIGVDTPESVKPDTPVQCYAKRASSFNRRLVAGKRVMLVLGREQLDRYGRLLAYVYLGRDNRRRTMVNAELVRRGFAKTLTIEPNTRFAAAFSKLQASAKRHNLGLWRACSASL